MEVYVTDVRALAGREAEALALLPPERREKLLRLRFADDRLRSAAGGLLLRRFIGGELQYGPRGKPFRPEGPAFSLSHSGRLAVLAVHTAPVGVDAERPGPCRDAVARRVFQPEERRWMAADPAVRFLYLWTRKEAVLKCLGAGFALDPASFSVLPDGETRAEGLTFSLHTAQWEEHTVSAAAAEGEAAFVPVFVPAETLLTP